MIDIFNTIAQVTKPEPEIVVNVCKIRKLKCGNRPFVATVDKETHTFCCQKGFETSLNEFAKNIKQIL